MRYGLDSSLPINAFSPRGKGPFSRGMTLEGGGGFNPVSWVGGAVQGIGDVLASIDPGPAIGKAGADLDKAVGQVIPGGWAMLGAIALTVLSAGTIDLEPEVLAAAEGAEVAGAGGAGVGLTSGAVDAALAEGALTPLQAALQAAGTGALYGGAMGGGLAAIQGGDPLKGALRGAFYGGLTGGLANGFSEALSSSNLMSQGLSETLGKALASASTGAVKGQDLATILQNTALSSGLGELAKGANQYIDPTITNAGTGAIGSAIKGGDPLTGAISGAAGSLIGQGVNVAKNEFNSLMAPSASANPATGKDWSETGSGLAGNGQFVSLGGEQMSADLAGRYLTTASEELSNKAAELIPTIGEQRSALLDKADTVKSQYEDFLSKQTALQTLISEKYNPVYENAVSLQNNLQNMYIEITNNKAIYDQAKEIYEASGNTNRAAYDYANEAATRLNGIIPKYNDISEEFSILNTQLSELFESEIQPVLETYQTAKTTLDTSVSSFATDQNKFSNLVDTASSYVTGINDISQGKLPTDYKAATLAMSAPTAQGFSEEELAAIQKGQQDAVAAAGTGTQTASTDNVGYVPPGTDVNYTGNNVEVTAPEGDFTNAEPIPIPPATEEPVVEEDLSQVILDSFGYGEGMTLNHMGDDRWVVVDSNTGAALGEINAPEAPVEPTPVEPTPVEPTPVEPTPVEPTPVEPTPVEPTPVEPTPVEPTPVEPVTPPSPIGSTTNPDGSVTTYYDDGSSKVTVAPDTTGTPSGTPDTTGETPSTTGGGLGTTGETPDTTGGGLSNVPFGAMDEDGNIMPGWSQDTNGEWKYTTPEVTTPEEPTTPPVTPPSGGGTSTGGGGTSTGGGSTSTGGGSTSTGGGTTPKPTTISPSSFNGLSNLAANNSALNAFLTPIFITGGAKIKQKNPLETFNNQMPAQEPDAQPIAQVPLDPYANTGFLSPISRAMGGSVFQNTMPNQEFATMNTGSDQPQAPKIIKQKNPLAIFGKAKGGSIEAHNPQFYSEGGLSAQHRYVKGPGDGTSDSVPAMLANGEFVIPADVVSSLGNGSNDSGAKILDEFLRTIRNHKHKSNTKKLPPDSKGPLSYLQQAKKKVKV